MWEVTVIESYPSGATVMGHFTTSDDQIESYIKDNFTNETRCVENGLLIAFTVFSKYMPNDDMWSKLYVKPRNLAHKRESNQWS